MYSAFLKLDSRTLTAIFKHFISALYTKGESFRKDWKKSNDWVIKKDKDCISVKSPWKQEMIYDPEELVDLGLAIVAYFKKEK
jgi:hypothetical protein